MTLKVANEIAIRITHPFKYLVHQGACRAVKF